MSDEYLDNEISGLKDRIRELEESRGGPRRRQDISYVGITDVMDSIVGDYKEYGYAKDVEYYIYEAVASALYEDWWDWLAQFGK